MNQDYQTAKYLLIGGALFVSGFVLGSYLTEEDCRIRYAQKQTHSENKGSSVQANDKNLENMLNGGKK